jgi:hypothetical protein
VNFLQDYNATGLYIRNNVNEVKYDLDYSGSNYNLIISRGSDSYYHNATSIASYATVANTDSRGLFQNTRINNTLIHAIKNGVSLQETSKASGSITANLPMIIGARYLLDFNTTRQYAFYCRTQGMTDPEAAIWYRAIQALMTSIGANV